MSSDAEALPDGVHFSTAQLSRLTLASREHMLSRRFERPSAKPVVWPMWERIRETIARWPASLFLARLALFVAQLRTARQVEVSRAKLLSTVEQCPRPARFVRLRGPSALSALAIVLAQLRSAFERFLDVDSSEMNQARNLLPVETI